MPSEDHKAPSLFLVRFDGGRVAEDGKTIRLEFTAENGTSCHYTVEAGGWAKVAEAVEQLSGLAARRRALAGETMVQGKKTPPARFRLRIDPTSNRPHLDVRGEPGERRSYPLDRQSVRQLRAGLNQLQSMAGAKRGKGLEEDSE